MQKSLIHKEYKEKHSTQREQNEERLSDTKKLSGLQRVSEEESNKDEIGDRQKRALGSPRHGRGFRCKEHSKVLHIALII